MTGEDARLQFSRRKLVKAVGIGGLTITATWSLINNPWSLLSGQTGPQNAVAQLYPDTETASEGHVGVVTISNAVPDRIDFAVRVSGAKELTLIEFVGCDATPIPLWQSGRGMSEQSLVAGTLASFPEQCQSETKKTADRWAFDDDIVIRVSLADSAPLVGRFQ